MGVDEIKGCDGKSHHLNLDSELIYVLFDKNLTTNSGGQRTQNTETE